MQVVGQGAGQGQHFDTSTPNNKFYKDIHVNGKVMERYFDLGSLVCVLRNDFAPKLGIQCDGNDILEI